MFLPGASAQSPARIGYTTTGFMIPLGDADTCHTVIEVRRSADSGPVNALRLFQTDKAAGAQRFRQVVVDAGAATMDLVVHTDSPVDENANFAGCRKLLTVGGMAPIELPLIPVHMVVHGGTMDLHFNPANPSVSIFTGNDQSFQAVSLGDQAIQGNSVRVVTASGSGVPQLDVRSAAKGGKITVGGLKLGSNSLGVEIGRDSEKAQAYANGGSIYTYDLVDTIQKNLILSSALAAVLIPGLLAWVKKNCFPSAKKDEEDSKQEE